MTINISGQVPAEEKNGMYELEDQWSAIEAPEPVIAIVVIEREGLNLKRNGTRKPVMTFVAIEPVPEGEMQEQAKELLQKARQERTGEQTFDLFPASDLDEEPTEPGDPFGAYDDEEGEQEEPPAADPGDPFGGDEE